MIIVLMFMIRDNQKKKETETIRLIDGEWEDIRCVGGGGGRRGTETDMEEGVKV